MESPDKAEVNELPAQGSGSPTERSTIEFPYTDLDNAIEVARAVDAVAGGTACSNEQLATHLQIEPKGGGYRLRVTGAKIYDVINYERGGRITLTDLGRRIIDPQGERAARRDAFLKVPLYARVFQEFNGRPLPPPPALERAMVSFGVGAKVADKARQVFLRSARQAGFFELSPDRLTEPPIRGGDGRGAASVPPAEVKPPARGTGGGGGDDDLHPLVRGLLLTLPKQPGEWPIKDRLNWLTMANSIFKMIYPAPADDAGDVEVSIAPPK